MKRIKNKQLCAALAAALGAGVTLSLVTGDALAQAQNKERIEVTGSNIKRTDTEPPSVVQVITREEIVRGGSHETPECPSSDYDPRARDCRLLRIERSS